MNRLLTHTAELPFPAISADMLVLKHELVQLIRLAYSDLLEHALQGNDANKLFYLKSKILEIESSPNSISTSQSEYLLLLKAELEKLPKSS